MSKHAQPAHPAAPAAPVAVTVFEPRPDVWYSLAAAAQLAGVGRRTLLVYCRAGLVQPRWQPPYGALAFSEEAIATVRQIVHLRATHGVDLAWIRTVFALRDEVLRLRTELHFLRHR